jgi:uncharacterized protein
MIIIKQPIQFDWNKGNSKKNFVKHNVSDNECEEVFYDARKKILKDKLHSQKESRYLLLGKTKKKRLLFLVFSIRNKKIRVISARDINNKERSLYE